VEKLKLRPWPGNVRELKNTIERLAIITPGKVIDSDPADLGEERINSPTPALAGGETVPDYMALPYRQAKSEFERRYFRSQLKAHGNNITQTAEAVSLDRTSLHKKLKTLGFKDWGEVKVEKPN
jgi:two-component system nitrogen regulation response regulator NtrX